MIGGWLQVWENLRDSATSSEEMAGEHVLTSRARSYCQGRASAFLEASEVVMAAHVAPPPSGVGSDIREKVARLAALASRLDDNGGSFTDAQGTAIAADLRAILSLLSSPSVGLEKGLRASRDLSPTASAAPGCDATTLVPDLSKRSAKSMSTAELWQALKLAGDDFDRASRAMQEDDEGGRGGSPLERYSERIDEIETALRRRGFNPDHAPVPAPAEENKG